MEPIDPTNTDIHPDPIKPQTWNELMGVEDTETTATQPGVVQLAVGNDNRLYANSPSTPPRPVVIPRVSVEGGEWVFSGTFSVTDADTVAWGAGTLTTEAGDTYAIGASNTGNMAAKTYIYFDVDVSTTAFQTTTTASSSVGAGKILIAIAQNATGEAKYMVLNDNQYNIDASNIVANSITANELSTSITYAGTIVIDDNGEIRSGQTDYNTGTGWWIGDQGGTPKLSIGDSSGDRMTFDGSELAVFGTFNIGGQTKTVDTFAEIQPALDEIEAAGGGTLYLASGTYTFTTDILVPGGVTLQGVSRDGVILDTDTFSLKIVGSDAYSTGTVTISNGDTTVVGSGTTWTSAMVGREIFLDGFWYEITARTDNTHIDIAFPYTGTNLAGATYVLATVNHNAALRKLTITGASGSGLVCTYAMEPWIDDIITTDCAIGANFDYVIYPLFFVSYTSNGVNLDADYVYGFEIRFSAFEDSTTGAGITMDNCGDATFFDSSVSGNTGNGVSLTSCRNIAFISVDASDNGDNGFEFVSGNNDIQFVASTAEGNTNDGYSLTATSDRISISTCSIKDNGGYGVNIVAATCDNNAIVNPAFSGNTTGDLLDAGTGTAFVTGKTASGTVSSGTASGSSDITCGFQPRIIRLVGRRGSSSSITTYDATWSNGTLTGISTLYNEGTAGTTSTGNELYDNGTGDYMTYSITSVTTTGFTIAWTETGTVGNSQTILWSAQ